MYKNVGGGIATPLPRSYVPVTKHKAALRNNIVHSDFCKKLAFNFVIVLTHLLVDCQSVYCFAQVIIFFFIQKL